MSDTSWDVKGCNLEYLESGMGEAIGRYLDDLILEEMPETITLVEYERNKPTEDEIDSLAVMVAERFLEVLQDDDRLGGDPDEGYPLPTERHKAAARLFVRDVLNDWTPFYCSPTGREEVVDVRDWLREYDPERLEGVSDE